jgi:hypothetical protein
MKGRPPLRWHPRNKDPGFVQNIAQLYHHRAWIDRGDRWRHAGNLVRCSDRVLTLRFLPLLNRRSQRLEQYFHCNDATYADSAPQFHFHGPYLCRDQILASKNNRRLPETELADSTERTRELSSNRITGSERRSRFQKKCLAFLIFNDFRKLPGIKACPAHQTTVYRQRAK